MEENFRSKESLIANVDGERLVVDGVLALILLDPLRWVTVVLIELLGNVWADVAEAFWPGEENVGRKIIMENAEKKTFSKTKRQNSYQGIMMGHGRHHKYKQTAEI